MSRRRRAWLLEHSRDVFVKGARAQGLRSRAAFKLMQIDDRDRILAPGRRVLDLGAAPGGWSQVAAARVGAQGCVVALDILPMAPVPGVEFVHGDCDDPRIMERLEALFGPRRAQLVLSDMAPNMTGVKAVDQARGMRLAERAYELGAQVLAPGGDLLLKVFQGEGFQEVVLGLRGVFQRVATRKPMASRGRSAETYILARGFGV